MEAAPYPLITFNSGVYKVTGAAHGAAIGAGGWNVAYSGKPTKPEDYIPDSYARKRGTPIGGNVLVNGGYIVATGGFHGAGFGGACSFHPSIADCVIRITGGTVLPKGAGWTGQAWLPDLGGEDGHVIIEGGSVYVSQEKAFIGIGDTAWGNDECLADGYDPSDPDDPNKVFMVTVDLSADGVDTEPIDNWQLTVGGVPCDYGAPTYFDKGKLYLSVLPKEAADKVIDADFSYTRTLEDGTQETVTPTTMYRDPHSPADPDDPNRTKLKRYVEFELDPDYEASLEKYYDGLPFDPYTWSGESPPSWRRRTPTTRSPTRRTSTTPTASSTVRTARRSPATSSTAPRCPRWRVPCSSPWCRASMPWPTASARASGGIAPSGGAPSSPSRRWCAT